jgi:uncharacterized protein YecT (DUF1311 family)
MLFSAIAPAAAGQIGQPRDWEYEAACERLPSEVEKGDCLTMRLGREEEALSRAWDAYYVALVGYIEARAFSPDQVDHTMSFVRGYLRDAALAWERSRDAECDLVSLDLYPGNGSWDWGMLCRLDATLERRTALLRETERVRLFTPVDRR